MKKQWSLFLITVLIFVCSLSDALPSAATFTLDDLDPEHAWRLQNLTFEGNTQFSTGQLQAELVTKTRTWYTPWRPFPPFDPNTVKTDLDRLRRFYRAQGYYTAEVTYHLEVQPADHLVKVFFTISEGDPVYVTELTLQVMDQPNLTQALQALRPALSLREGVIFTEERYQQTEAKLKEFYLDLHHGRVKVQRHAQVITDQQAARVRYGVTVGPPTVFGKTTVEGTESVDPSLALRELRYQPGEPFSAKAIETSRANLLKLDMFSSVRFLQEEVLADPTVIPMRIQVEEKPLREWQLGVGYGTEDEFRGQVRWRHNNWLGGGRRLDVQVKASSLLRQIDISFLQPHFIDPATRFMLTVRPEQDDEPGYLLHMTRLQPRLEHEFSETFTGFLAYRLEYDHLNNVPSATVRLFRDFQRKGLLSGFGGGLLWNTSNDPLNPTAGGVTSFSAEQVGGVLGGEFNFYKLQGEVKRYHQISSQIVLGSRLRLGFAEPVSGSADVPLFERFYAGGANSVRGYGRRRLGPLSSANDPIGGRSLIEGSLELRRPLFNKIGGALFLDFGQVSLRSFDVPLDDLRFAPGFGVSYATPVGPIRLDLGFPLDPPRGDQPWQVHFSIGQFF